MVDQKGPLVVWPSLAEVIGLNEGIVFHQIHYWVGKSKNYIDGEYWVYNSYKEWSKQFPFWSERTLRRIIKSLEDSGIIKSRLDLNRSSFDKTKWYTINYEVLRDILAREGVSFELDSPKSHRENEGLEEKGTVNLKGKSNGKEHKKVEVNDNIGNIDIKMNDIIDNPYGHNSQSESEKEPVHRGKMDNSISENNHKTTKETSFHLNQISKSQTLNQREGEAFKDDSLDLGVSLKDTSLPLLVKKSEVYKFYVENICPIPRAFDIEELEEMCKSFKEEEVVIEAMKIAVRNNARKLSYIRRILMDWEECGVKTLEEAQALLAERRNKNGYSRNLRENNGESKISGVKISKENHGEQDYSGLELI